jgi:hypothetical protein
MALLLHSGDIHPSIPTGYSVHMEETYENMDLFMKAVTYSKYGRRMYGDLKVTSRNAVWLHKVLLFSLRMGQLSKRLTL